MGATLESYREAVSVLPRPTPAQALDFVSYVFEAHSWYKHLPTFPPGKRFYFYMDPCAGMRVHQRRDGRIELVERQEGENFFHYNEMPTTSWRARFGHLGFQAGAGRSVGVVGGDGGVSWASGGRHQTFALPARSGSPASSTPR